MMKRGLTQKPTKHMLIFRDVLFVMWRNAAATTSDGMRRRPHIIVCNIQPALFQWPTLLYSPTLSNTHTCDVLTNEEGPADVRKKNWVKHVKGGDMENGQLF